jgi:transcriptional regulator with XRE-family HTH domain
LDNLSRVKRVIKWLIFNEFAENETELAQKLGYTKSSFSQIVNGKVPLSNKFIEKLCAVDENINKVWVIENKGNMLKNNNSILIGNGNITNGNNNNVDSRQYYSDSPDVLRAQIDDRDRLLQEKEARIKEKDAQIKEKDAQINKLLSILSNK